jgi:hypothetical protein
LCAAIPGFDQHLVFALDPKHVRKAAAVTGFYGVLRIVHEFLALKILRRRV